MRPELSTLSFLSLILTLVALVCIRPLRSEVPIYLLASWLVILNLVHGINSVIWAGNVEVQALVWCDIVTKLVLGAIVAIPFNCISILRHLARLVTDQETNNYFYTQRSYKLIDFVLGLAVPLIFMSFHPVVQDYRFSLVEDFGCSASIHPSVAGLLILWLPVIMVCVVSFFYAGYIIFSVTCRTFLGDICKVQFYTRLAYVVLATMLSFAIALVQVFSPSTFEPWVSWEDTHESFFKVNVIHVYGGAVEATWWLLFVISVLFTGTYVGAEIFIKYRKGVSSRAVVPATMQEVSPISPNRRSSLSVPHPIPHHVQLKSGWDGMLDPPPTRRFPRSPKSFSKPTLRLSLVSRRGSPTDSMRSSSLSAGEHQYDEAFAAATLGYLSSPPAQVLGLRSSPSPKSPRITPPLPQVPPQAALEQRASVLDAPEDSNSVISSIWNTDWPLPPETPQTAISVRSSASTTDTYGYALYPTSPARRSVSPFQDSSVPVPEIKPLSVTRHSLRKKRSQPAPPGVMMTVVRESY